MKYENMAVGNTAYKKLLSKSTLRWRYKQLLS